MTMPKVPVRERVRRSHEADGKRERGKVERRERLYEAALALFRSQGYEATTVADITRRAGLAKGTFFNYFPTKDAVLRYLGTREVGRLGAASVAGSGASSLAKLKRLMGALGISLEKDRELVSLIFRRGVTVPQLLAGDAGGFSIQPAASLLIRQAQREGDINPGFDPDMLAAALDALYLQQLVRWCESEQNYALSDRLTGMVDLLLIGITPNSPPTPARTSRS
jgi:AcrR family transcriptional regulator